MGGRILRIESKQVGSLTIDIKILLLGYAFLLKLSESDLESDQGNAVIGLRLTFTKCSQLGKRTTFSCQK